MKRKELDKKRLVLVKEQLRLIADRRLALVAGGRGDGLDVTSMDPVCSETL